MPRRRSAVDHREEISERVVDLRRPLLLSPVAAAREDDRPVEPRQRRREATDRRPAPDGRAITVAADEQRRHFDRAIAERGEILPIAIDVAVSVQSTGEAGALE